MIAHYGGENFDRLLEELHAKKAWLDQMIAGLEAAAESPQHRLIAEAAESFESAGTHTPKVDIRSSKRSELQLLAERVGGRGRAAGRRRAPANRKAKA